MAYLALPMLIFLFGWLKLIYALPLSALLVFLLVQWGGEIKANVRPNRKALVICGIVALLWTATSGAGGFGYQNWDYEKHNAIFKMLIFSEWPALFDADRTLVYTIGYHLPAAAFGKVFGWAAANVALFTWTLAGAYLTLLWFVRFVRGG
ncbi:MAG: hypothetical protein OXF42_05405 [Candidatus Dadabacteria bacterium]|nr:hypothetical protein [Candidatus Dadabacteria bacterium]